MPKLPSFTVVSGQIGVTKDLRRFTLAEYQHLIELGIFGEDERLELIDGLVVEMSPIRPSHAACVDNLNGLINHLLQQSMDSGPGADYHRKTLCLAPAGCGHSYLTTRSIRGTPCQSRRNFSFNRSG